MHEKASIYEIITVKLNKPFYNGNWKTVFLLLYSTRCCHKYLVFKLLVYRKL